jgi:hypothetical protein
MASGTAAAPVARDGVNTLAVLNTVGRHDMDGGRADEPAGTGRTRPGPGGVAVRLLPGLDPSELAL